MLTAGEPARWEQIKHDFLRSKAMGGDDADIAGELQAMASAPREAPPVWDDLPEVLPEGAHTKAPKKEPQAGTVSHGLFSFPFCISVRATLLETRGISRNWDGDDQAGSTA